MVEIIWEFVVKEDASGHFELAYGPGGAWSKLCAGAGGFRGTTLLRDAENPGRYLRVEVWDSVTQRDRAWAEQSGEVADLEAAMADWTESAHEVGVFQMRAETAVRPRPGAGRRR